MMPINKYNTARHQASSSHNYRSIAYNNVYKSSRSSKLAPTPTATSYRAITSNKPHANSINFARYNPKRDYKHHIICSALPSISSFRKTLRPGMRITARHKATNTESQCRTIGTSTQTLGTIVKESINTHNPETKEISTTTDADTKTYRRVGTNPINEKTVVVRSTPSTRSNSINQVIKPAVINTVTPQRRTNPDDGLPLYHASQAVLKAGVEAMKKDEASQKGGWLFGPNLKKDYDINSPITRGESYKPSMNFNISLRNFRPDIHKFIHSNLPKTDYRDRLICLGEQITAFDELVLSVVGPALRCPNFNPSALRISVPGVPYSGTSDAHFISCFRLTAVEQQLISEISARASFIKVLAQEIQPALHNTGMEYLAHMYKARPKGTNDIMKHMSRYITESAEALKHHLQPGLMIMKVNDSRILHNHSTVNFERDAMKNHLPQLDDKDFVCINQAFTRPAPLIPSEMTLEHKAEGYVELTPALIISERSRPDQSDDYIVFGTKNINLEPQNNVYTSAHGRPSGHRHPQR